MKIIKTIINNEDERGRITDLLQDTDINSITRITQKKGTIRGNHYHNKTYQYNYLISGSVKLVTQMPDSEKNELVLKPGDLICTVPSEKHAIFAMEDSDMIVFTYGPRAGTNYETDTYRLKESLV